MVAIQLRIIPNRVRQWWISLQVGDVMSIKNEVLCGVYGITGEGCICPINVTNRTGSAVYIFCDWDERQRD